MIKDKKQNCITSEELMRKMNEPILWYEEIYNVIYRFFYKIEDILYEIKFFIQRGKNGFADCDCWDLGSYLSGWMPNALRKLKKNSSGCPAQLFDKNRKGNECWKWKEILEKMAIGFEAAEKIKCSHLYKGKRFEKLRKKEEEGLSLFIKWFHALWD